MSSTTNIPVNSRSMNGIITIGADLITADSLEINNLYCDVNATFINPPICNTSATTTNQLITLGGVNNIINSANATGSYLNKLTTYATSNIGDYYITFGDNQTIKFTGTTTQAVYLPTTIVNANLGTQFLILKDGGNINIFGDIMDETNTIQTSVSYGSSNRVIAIEAISLTSPQWRVLYSQPVSLLPTANVFTNTNEFTAGITTPSIISTSGVSVKLLTTTSSSINVTSGVMSFIALNPSATFQSFKKTFTGSGFTITYIDWSSIVNMPLNAEWTFIIQNNTSGSITIKNNIVSNTPSTFLHGIYPFDVVIPNGYNNAFIKIVRYDTVEANISAGETSNSIGGSISSILNFTNNWTGVNNFNSILPTSTLNATTSTQLISKGFADGQYGKLGTINAWNQINSFAQFPTYSGLSTPSASNSFITLSYADSRYAELADTNIYTGTTNTYNNDVITKGYFQPQFPSTTTSMRIGLNALQNSDSLSIDTIAIGINALRGTTNTAYDNKFIRCIAIGTNAMSTTTYGTTNTANNDNVIIGYNASRGTNVNNYDNVIIGSQACGSTNAGGNFNSVVIGSKISVNSGTYSYSVVIGALNFPSTSINNGTIVGYGNFANSTLSYANGLMIFGDSNMRYCQGFNRAICIGTGSLSNLNNAFSVICVGAESLTNLTNCGYVTGLGSLITSSSTISNTTVIGTKSNVILNNVVYFGGNDNGVYQDVLPAGKNKILCNSSLTLATETLSFEMGEHINITTNTTTNITLPVPASKNIGARFTLIKTYSTVVSITITASAGLTIFAGLTNTNTLSFPASEYYLTLVCINTTGTAWVRINHEPLSSTINVSSTNVILGEGADANATSLNNTVAVGYRAGFKNITGNGTYIGTSCGPNLGYIYGSHGQWSYNGATYSFTTYNRMYVLATNKPISVSSVISTPGITVLYDENTLTSMGTFGFQNSPFPTGGQTGRAGVYQLNTDAVGSSSPPQSNKFTFTASYATSTNTLTVTATNGELTGGLFVNNSLMTVTPLEIRIIKYLASNTGGVGTYQLSNTYTANVASNANWVAWEPIYYPSSSVGSTQETSQINSTCIGNNSIVLEPNSTQIGNPGTSTVVGRQYLSKANPTVLTGDYAMYDDPILYTTYLFVFSANQIITLPLITPALVGTEIRFRRVGGVPTTTLSITSFGNLQSVCALTIPSSFQTGNIVIIPSGNTGAVIIACRVNTTNCPTYAWVQV